MPDGTIRETLPTTQGVEPPIRVGSLIAAADACRLAGNGSHTHILPDTRCPGEEVLAIASPEGWAAYRYVNFDQPITETVLEMEANGFGEVKIWGDDELIGEIPVRPTNGERWKMKSTVRSVSGIHTLYLEWKLDEECTAIIKRISMLL